MRQQNREGSAPAARRSRRLTKKTALAAAGGAVLVLGSLGGGIAFASGTIPGPGGVINGCYQNATGHGPKGGHGAHENRGGHGAHENQHAGALRVVPSGTACGKNETAISWNQAGATGATGQPGPGASVFTSSATYKVPSGVTQLVVSLRGGGGGGGTSNGGEAGGGGGEAGVVKALVSVTGGESLTVTVGTGGTAESAGTSSAVSASATVLVMGTGGGGGSAASTDTNAGGAGGTFTTTGVALSGTVNAAGASSTGPNCPSSAGTGGVGGGTPGTAGAGGAGASGTCSISGLQQHVPGASGQNGYVEILPVAS